MRDHAVSAETQPHDRAGGALGGGLLAATEPADQGVVGSGAIPQLQVVIDTALWGRNLPNVIVYAGD